MRETGIAILAACLAGCAVGASNPTLTMQYEEGWKSGSLESFVQRAGNQDVAIFELGHTAWVSHHVAIVRTAETPHYHRFHDMTVELLSGEGIIHLEGGGVTMRTGDVVHVRRGSPHWFESTGRNPSAALVIFSPPFDGRDRVPVDAAGPKEPKAAQRPWWKLF